MPNNWPSETFLHELRNRDHNMVAKEFEALYAQLQGWLQVAHNADGSQATGSGAPADPNRSVQFNDNGAFGGNRLILADPSRAGATYGVGPDQHTLAVGVASGTAGILALFNETAGTAKALSRA